MTELSKLVILLGISRGKPCKILEQNMYAILGFAKHTETGEILVLYQALYEDTEMHVNYDVFARPADMFFSEVDRNKYPDIRQKYRFEEWHLDTSPLLVFQSAFKAKRHLQKD